jgi:diadenosine tetraphosphate (Ap4A) HIT family hydrolase
MKFWIFLLFLVNVSLSIYATCPFCDPEVIETQVAFESESLRIFVDYAPRVKGHLLIVPKRHVVKAHDLSKQEWEEVALLIPQIVKIFKKYLNTDQYMILEKNGPKAYQHVPHVHFHLLPIQSQSWREIFDKVPPILPEEECKYEVSTFRNYFLLESYN